MCDGCLNGQQFPNAATAPGKHAGKNVKTGDTKYVGKHEDPDDIDYYETPHGNAWRPRNE